MATKEMTKAERRAAIKAAKKAEKEAKAQQTTAQTESTETQKPNNESKENAQEKKKSNDKKSKKENVPTFIPEEVTEPIGKNSAERAVERANNLIGSINAIPVGSANSSLDGKSMLAYVMHERYGKNEELRKHYPELHQDLCRNIDVVVLLAMVDVRQDLLNRGETGQLKLNVTADQIMPLQSMADMLGIELAPAKALPGSDSSQLEINFTESKVPEELTKDAGKKIDEKPELDPKKVKTDEDIKKALEYLLRSDKNVATALVNTVEWYRTNRMLNEENADAKLTMDEKTVEDWMNEIFSITKPTSLFKGLGRTVYLYTSQLGSPVFAHSLLHNYISKTGWSEEQIASVVKTLIQENFRLKLKDDENVKPEEDKALRAIAGTLGSEYVNTLFNNANMDLTGVADDKKNELENIQKDAKKILGVVRTNYFAKDHVPTTDELRMRIGQIINLYRDPADRLMEYCQNSITSPEEGEYPEKTEKKN